MDWLRRYGVDHAPPSWPLNDIFLRIIENAQRRWQDAGYDWKFGIEICFALNTEKSLDRKPDTLGQAWPKEDPAQGLTKEMFRKVRGHGRNTARLRQAVSKMRREAEQIAAMHGIAVEKVVTELDQIDANLRSAKPAIKEDGMINAYMAWIHSRPYAEGGVIDLIAPRFGDYLHGIGWWDDYQSAELRTPVLSSPFAVIEHHHKLMDVITRTASDFGLIPNFLHGHTPHIHFSIWDRRTGQNMMDFHDDTLDFREGVVSGLVDLARHAPYLVTQLNYADGLSYEDFEFATWRVGSGIRQCEGHWELRRQSCIELGHMARDLAMLMAQSLPPILPPEQRTAPDFSRRHFVMPAREQLVARHRFGNAQHMLTAMLNHSHIRDKEDDKGTLHCPFGCIDWGLETLQRVVGPHALNDFTARRDEGDPLANLSTQEGWTLLMQSLRYEDGALQTGHLSPELAALFEEIEILGTRRVPAAHAVTLHHNQSSLIYTFREGQPLIATLPEVVAAEDWDAIRAFYKDRLDFELARYCSDDVIRLADKFRTAAGDVEDPTPIILQDMAVKRMESNLLGVNWGLMEIATDTHPEIDDLGAEDLAELPIEILKPFYVAALADRIAHERAADQPDNRQIAFLEAARAYADERFYNFGDTLPHIFDPLLESYARRCKEDDATQLDIDASCLVQSMKMNHQLWPRFRQHGFESARVTAALNGDEQDWQAYWGKARASYETALAASPRLRLFFEKLDDAMVDVFQHLRNMAVQLDPALPPAPQA